MTDRSHQRYRWLPDLLGVAWVIIAAGAVMAPALSHGFSLGPFDQLAKLGLSQKHAPAPHNPQVFDLIREIIPWTNLAWTQVHHGYLPLWNPYSALGDPLAFNWQSGTFGLPALLGYLVPVRFAFTVQVLVTLVIGGTGMYVLGRVMRLGVLGAAMAATVFELSGSFMAVLGWPIASVMSWAGWLFACLILVIRGNHRRRDIVLLALVIAFAIYAGQPDTLAVLVVGFVVFLVVMLAIRARRNGGMRAIGRPALDTVLAVIAGLGLAAPLLLPAAQLSSGTIRGLGRHSAFPISYALHIIFQSFNGSPVKGSAAFFAPTFGYVETSAYVGVIALVLAVVGVALSRRRPAIIALIAVVVVTCGLVFLSPLVSFLNQLPLFGEVRWIRAVQVLVFALAILAGVGMDVLVRSPDNRAVRNWLGGGFAGVGVILLGVWAFGRGHLSWLEAAIRNRSFVWPAVEVGIGLAVFGFLLAMSRFRQGRGLGHGPLGNPSRLAGVVLLVCSTGFLVSVGAPWWSSGTTYLKPTPSERALQKAVGSSLVGFGNSSCLSPPTLGIQANVNIAFGVHELDSYDPLTPRNLFTSWTLLTGHYPRPTGAYAVYVPLSMFCPVVTSTADARLFGISYVLEPHDKSGPPGSVFDMKVGRERLYRIPGASLATLTPIPASGALPR